MANDRPHIAVFLATSGHSGVDRIMTNLLPEMARQGARVDLLKVRNHGPLIESEQDGLRIVELGSAHANTSLLSVIRYLRRERPDVLLSDKDRVNRTALWATALARCNTVNVLRMGTTVSRNLKGKSRLERWGQQTSIKHFYGRAARIIVPSRGVAEDLATHFPVDRSRIKVLPSPVLAPSTLSQAEAEVALPWPDGTPYVVGVGHLCTRKDFPTLLRAVTRVRQNRACHLVLLGDGPRYDELKQLANELGLADAIHMPGFVSNPYPYIRNAKVMVLTSKWEGMPVVLVESLGLGTPVVSTDCPSGPRELLDGGRLGELVPLQDVEATAQAIMRSLDNSPNAEDLRNAVADYNVTTSAAGYLRVCIDAVTEHQGGAT